MTWDFAIGKTYLRVSPCADTIRGVSRVWLRHATLMHWGLSSATTHLSTSGDVMGNQQSDAWARKRTKKSSAAPAAPASIPDAAVQVDQWAASQAQSVVDALSQLHSNPDGWLRMGTDAELSTSYIAFKFHRGRFKGRYEYVSGKYSQWPSLVESLARNVELCYMGKRTPSVDHPHR